MNEDHDTASARFGVVKAKTIIIEQINFTVPEEKKESIKKSRSDYSIDPLGE